MATNKIPEGTHNFSVNLASDLKADLERVAAIEQVTQSHIVRRLIRTYTQEALAADAVRPTPESLDKVLKLMENAK